MWPAAVSPECVGRCRIDTSDDHWPSYTDDVDHGGLQLTAICPIIFIPPELRLPSWSRRWGAFLTAVVQAAVGLQNGLAQPPYPGVRNRAAVALHLRRDWSQKLALAAKMRDRFTCKVCGINFTQLYGKLGQVSPRSTTRSHSPPKMPRKVTRVGISSRCAPTATACCTG